MAGGVFPAAGADPPDPERENDRGVSVPDGPGCDEELYRDAGPARDPALAGDAQLDVAGESDSFLVADQAVEGSAGAFEL